MEIIGLFILISKLSFRVLSSTAVKFYDGHGKWCSSSCKWGSPCHIRKWKDRGYPWTKGMWECINYNWFCGRNFIVSFFVVSLMHKFVSSVHISLLLLPRIIFSGNETWTMMYSFTTRNRNKFLKLDAASHEALQIFQIDKHSSHMGIGRAKEG